MPQVIPHTKASIDALFAYLAEGWLSFGGVAINALLDDWNIVESIRTEGESIVIVATVPVEGTPGIRLTARFTQTILKIELGKYKAQVAFALPMWSFWFSLIQKRPQVIAGTPYTLTPMGSFVVPKLALASSSIRIDLQAPFPKVGKGHLWAYLRGVVITPTEATLDIYRPAVEGWIDWDLARDPVFTWK